MQWEKVIYFFFEKFNDEHFEKIITAEVISTPIAIYLYYKNIFLSK